MLAHPHRMTGSPDPDEEQPPAGGRIFRETFRRGLVALHDAGERLGLRPDSLVHVKRMLRPPILTHDSPPDFDLRGRFSSSPPQLGQAWRISPAQRSQKVHS
jgi:hypothetical protein